MQIRKTSLILFFIFLLVLSIVNAVQIIPQSLSDSLCPRDTGQFTHIITNDNSAAKDYTINLKGSASAWSTVVPSGFILGPGESKTVYTYVTPSESSEAGTYNLQIEASSPEDTKSISHVVTVKSCYAASLATAASSKSSCPSDPVQYNLALTNNGEYAETFHLSLNGNLASRGSLSDNLLIIGKKETKNVIVFVNAPTDSGEYSLTLVAESESGRIRQSLPVFLTVNPCYDFTLKVSGNNTYNMCDRSYVVIPLNLRNDGTTINTYKVNVDGPVWARLEKTDFTLKDQEARSFNLVFAPDYGAMGDYGIRLSVLPEKGDIKSVTDFAVTVRKCNSVDVQFVTNKEDSCKGTVNSYQALVTNNGEVRKSYKLQLDAPSWVTLDEKDTLFTLDPKQQRKIILTGVPVDNIKEGSYDIKLKAAATDESAASVSDVDTLTLNVKDAANCYKPAIETKYSNLVVYYDSSVAVPVEIRNDGVKKGDFSLLLSGNAAKFSTLTPSALSLDPGRSDIVYLYVAPNVNVKLGSYDGSISLSVKNGPVLVTKKFNIEVTDVKEKATVINIPSGTEPIVQKSSYWQNLKSWFKNTFVGSNTQVSNSTNSTNVSNTQSGFSKYKYYILGFLITILVIVLLVILFKDDEVSPKKKSSKKKSNKETEDIKDKVEE